MCLHHHPYLDRPIRSLSKGLADYIGTTAHKARIGALPGNELLRRRQVATSVSLNRKPRAPFSEVIHILGLNNQS